MGAIGTFTAIVAALAIGLGVTGLIFRPRLEVTLESGLPDFCPVETGGLIDLGETQTVTDDAGNVHLVLKPTRVKLSEQYYCRFRVNNRGGWWSASARDVQVLLSEL